MIILAGTIRVPAQKLADTRPMLLHMVEASRAEAGCLAYSLAEDLTGAGLIRIFELFRDNDARATFGQPTYSGAPSRVGIRDRQIT